MALMGCNRLHSAVMKIGRYRLMQSESTRSDALLEIFMGNAQGPGFVYGIELTEGQPGPLPQQIVRAIETAVFPGDVYLRH